MGDTLKVQVEPDDSDVGLIAGLALLLARGVLLWLVIPLAALAWLIGLPFWRKREARMEQLIGWSDLNLIAFLQRGPFRLFIRNPLKWTPASEVSRVEHRVTLFDLT